MIGLSVMSTLGNEVIKSGTSLVAVFKTADKVKKMWTIFQLAEA